MGDGKAFSMFPLQGDRGKNTSSSCSIGAGGEARAGDAITGVGIEDGGTSEVEPF